MSASNLAMTLLTTLILMGALTGCQSSQAKNKPAAQPSTFQVRQPEKQRLKNGLNVLWIEDQSLPYISMQMLFNSGYSQDPKGLEGIASMTVSLLEKGTSRKSASQMSEEIEQIGSDFSVAVQPDYMTVNLSALSFHKEKALALYKEILFSPVFPNAEIERIRSQYLGGIQKFGDRPDQLVRYIMPTFVYGTHPYGHAPEGFASTIKKINRAKIKRFFEDHFRPQNATLAVVGQFDQAFKQQIVQTFEQWENKPPKTQDLPPFPAWKGVDVLLVDRSDLNQAQVRIAQKGVNRLVPEFLELRAAQEILGGGFGSRLFEEIREKRGLTYGINSNMENRIVDGTMGIGTFTRIDKLGEILTETIRVYKEFIEGGVTDAEVTQAKALMKGIFPRLFETPESLATQLLVLGRFGVPQDYLPNYLSNVDKLTKESINAAIKKYFDSENLKILVYAPKDKAEAILKPMGQLNVRDYRSYLR